MKKYLGNQMIYNYNYFTLTQHMSSQVVIQPEIHRYNSSSIDNYFNLYLINSINYLDKLSTLNDNWDGYGARKIDPAVIAISKDLVLNLRKYNFEIFPLLDGRLQLELYKNNVYLELSVAKERITYYLNDTQTAKTGELQMDKEIILSFLERYYAN